MAAACDAFVRDPTRGGGRLPGRLLLAGGGGGGYRWQVGDETFLGLRGGGFVQVWPGGSSERWGPLGMGLRLTLGLEWEV
ncbi:MAG: hypothetical protein HY907_20235 [Deltaproteobacteria bacterium]|nr:hypothetical protein [Deltaproteobacteria bacterium]